MIKSNWKKGPIVEILKDEGAVAWKNASCGQVDAFGADGAAVGAAAGGKNGNNGWNRWRKEDKAVSSTNSIYSQHILGGINVV